jgi:opacity protein-like surface antigen
MQKTIVATLALLASTAVASATDLPSKTTPAAPAPVFTQTQNYFGVNVGGNLKEDTRVYSGGAVAGWNVLPFLAVEGTYDFSRPQNKVLRDWNYGNQFAVNAVPQYKVPGTDITAYGLGGVGYRWNTKTADYSVYNIGGGLKYEFAKNVEFDTRYRRIEAIEKKERTNTTAEDRVTAGVNYKF